MKEIFVKNKILILSVFLILLVGATGTYAWFTWSSANNTEVTLTIGKLADVIFQSGNDINVTDLSPVFYFNDTTAITTFSIDNRDTSGESFDYFVTLNINTIDSALISESLKYKLISDNEVIGEGNFVNARAGNVLNIATGTISAYGVTDYTFYIYIDSNFENASNLMNKTLTGNLMVTAQ